MELFSRTYTVDWMGKAKYFVALSLLLMLIGGTAWYKAGSLPYGIDFKGGTLVYVRFAQRVPLDRIREGLAVQGLGSSTIQQIRDITRPDLNEVVIGLEQQGEGEGALDAGKNAILEALRRTFGTVETNKQDLNAAGVGPLAEFLTRKDPLALGSTAGDRYNELARRILDYRDSERSGLITGFDELKKVEGVNDAVLNTLRGDFYLGEFAVRNVEIVGPKVGAQLRRQALLATIYAFAGMLVYIALRFEWVYGAASVLAVVHDVLITLGFFSLFKLEISLTVIAALLTLVGYSMNDKIVIFDRVRENLRLRRREPFRSIVNLSINQTLSRTFLTGGMTFVGLVVLFVMGGDVLRGFAFALVAGIVIGTYSSFGIAAPIVAAYNQWRGHRAAVGAPEKRARQSDAAENRVAAAGRR